MTRCCNVGENITRQETFTNIPGPAPTMGTKKHPKMVTMSPKKTPSSRGDCITNKKSPQRQQYHQKSTRTPSSHFKLIIFYGTN